MSAGDVRYGRRGGRWAAQAPGALVVAMDEYRAARAAQAAAEAAAAAEDASREQLSLFDDVGGSS